MGSHGVRDQVAIVGMGCTPFAELWEKGLDDLIVDASTDAFASAGISKDEVDAYWFGTAQSGMSGITLARPLQLRNKPVTRVENYCATGSEALRAAVYAVASGAYDVAMAVGAEKVKDSGFQGLNAMNPPGDGTARLDRGVPVHEDARDHPDHHVVPVGQRSQQQLGQAGVIH